MNIYSRRWKLKHRLFIYANRCICKYGYCLWFYIVIFYKGSDALINIKQKPECCGCNACGDICPKDAITFTCDKEGFLYPKVDKSKCVECGLCEKTCPVLHSGELKKNDLPESICYAAEHKNLEVVFDSTSGGLFSALAEQMYRQNGFVGGAIFNEDLSVSQFISADEKDLVRLRSSKYLQSNAEGFYKEVKRLLVLGEKVLICGTPCQMAAMRAFLGKDYENLIIVDFICRGVNSPKIWQKYLQSFEERYGSKVVFAKAKSKEYGWRNLTQKVRLADGREFFETKETSNFMRGFLRTNAYCRPACYECHFKGFPRMADITLADFWGIEKYNRDIEKNLGTSLVMVNSKKGQAYFEKTRNNVKAFVMPFSSILEGNVALLKPLEMPKINREDFFDDVDKMTFIELAEKYILSSEMTFKQKVKNNLRKGWNFVRFIKRIVSVTGCHPKALYQTVKYSGINNLIHKKGIIFATNCTTNISANAKMDIRGLMIIGEKGKFPGSKLESRLCIDSGAVLRVHGNVTFSYGCDIEIFHDAELTFEGNRILPATWSNIGCTIICGKKIEIAPDVIMGRNVTIRDNNGGHYLNRPYYEDSRPVKIGEKSWLCEQCMIMPGVDLGASTVVGARSLVLTREPIPAHSMLVGAPAKIIDDDVQWKW